MRKAPHTHITSDDRCHSQGATHTLIDSVTQTKTLQDRFLAYLSKSLLDDDVRRAGFYSTLDLEDDNFYYWKSSKWARGVTNDHLVKYGPLTKEYIDSLINDQGVCLTPELLTSLETGEIRMWLRLADTPEGPGKPCLNWVTQTKEEVLNPREPVIEKEDRDLRLRLTTYLNDNQILTPCNKGYPSSQFGNLDGTGRRRCGGKDRGTVHFSLLQRAYDRQACRLED
ncbi:hypothetical protein EV426DRAFT_641146 [Tirmania nivea]|nr:hypothetical protein EV426DRAFT_641146 [Tirmania nivea]